MRKIVTKFAREDDGAAIIEAAILLPALITLLIGVFQVGLYMQAQNAVRGLSGEMSRYMAVEAQKGNVLTDDQIRNQALGLAVTAPYMLDSDNLEVFVENEETQSINRVRKIDVRMNYDVPSLLGFEDIKILTLDYTRSVFIPGPEIVEETDGGDGTTDGGTTDGGTTDGGDGTVDPTPVAG